MQALIFLFGLILGISALFGIPMWLGANEYPVWTLLIPTFVLFSLDGRNINRFNQTAVAFRTKERRISTIFWLFLMTPAFIFLFTLLFYWIGAKFDFPKWP